MHDETDQKQDQEDDKQDLGNSGKRYRDSSESKDCRKNRDYKEDQRVIQHLDLLSHT
jgi:hypothetical protein